MRRPFRTRFALAYVSGILGVLMVGTVALSPVASAEPSLARQGLLAPTISYSIPSTGTIQAFGAYAVVPIRYTCSATLDSPLLSQLLGSYSTYSLQVTQAFGSTVTQGTRTLTDLSCDGTKKSRPFEVIVAPGLQPFITGSAVGLVVMQVCDLFGCTSSSFAAPISFS